MTDLNASGDPAEEATLFPKTAGERLRDARKAQGMSLAEIAERTRVPIRHLEGIENSDFSALPSPTYAVGFAKAYARVVGLDEALIGREVRGQRTATAPSTQYQPYEAPDPKRLPPRGLAIGAALVALLAVVVFGLVYGSTLFQSGGSQPVPAAADAEPTAAAPTPVAAAPAAPANGQVVLSANDVVWLRVYTPDKTLYEAEMKPGDRYEIPADAV
ncbi:MAG: helix-turn-helix domain-containing protein, partial [Sphingomonas sp.]|nr:helix-turn-helix domain-containing protein [Sphingomonas sp.]